MNIVTVDGMTYTNPFASKSQSPTVAQMTALRAIERKYNVAIDYSQITSKEKASSIIYKLNKMIEEGLLQIR
jgi:hypothetical protein